MAEDPVRLCEESGSELLKALLSAAREEGPNPAALQSTLTAVGVGSGIIATAGTASGVSAASVASGASGGAHGLAGAASLGSAKGVASTTLLVVAKWLGAGALAGVMATSAAYVVSEQVAPTRSVAATPTAQKSAPLVLPKAPPPAATSIPAVPVASEEPAAPALKPPTAAALPAPTNSLGAPSAAPLSVPAEVDPSAPLAAELALLDSARQALAQGNAAHALRSLDDYDAQFRHPNLAPEALYLRLEALTLRGDKAGTLAVARRLLQAYPSGPHAARARSVLGLDQ